VVAAEGESARTRFLTQVEHIASEYIHLVRFARRFGSIGVMQLVAALAPGEVIDKIPALISASAIVVAVKRDPASAASSGTAAAYETAAATCP
jgi:hypothetical protein